MMVETVRKLKQVKYWLKFHVVLLNQEILQEVYQELLKLLEAHPSNPAVVSEIDGVVSLEKLKDNREIIIESKFGDVRKYLVKLSSQILVQENDFC
jgi:DNA-directed RNA polymerase subunit beta'